MIIFEGLMIPESQKQILPGQLRIRQICTSETPVDFQRTTRPYITEDLLWLFHAGFFFGIFFDPEDGGDIFL
jgi:hypothetical protein